MAGLFWHYACVYLCVWMLLWDSSLLLAQSAMGNGSRCTHWSGSETPGHQSTLRKGESPGPHCLDIAPTNITPLTSSTTATKQTPQSLVSNKLQTSLFLSFCRPFTFMQDIYSVQR